MQFPATIIIGQDSSFITDQIALISQQTKNAISPNNPDIFSINQTTGWGIEVVREISHFISRKPIAHPSKMVIIYQADNLGPEAQNALLKVLEEPGPNNYLLLTTTNEQQLLETIRSRCHLIKQPHRHFTPQFSILLFDQKVAPDQLIATFEQYLQDQIRQYHQKLIIAPDNSIQTNITKLCKARELFQANIDIKSVLDWLMLS